MITLLTVDILTECRPDTGAVCLPATVAMLERLGEVGVNTTKGVRVQKWGPILRDIERRPVEVIRPYQYLHWSPSDATPWLVAINPTCDPRVVAEAIRQWVASEGIPTISIPLFGPNLRECGRQVRIVMAESPNVRLFVPQSMMLDIVRPSAK